MTDSSKAVFLSYASQDAEAARRICEALRAAGIEVWFDQSELRGGDAWDRQIRKQIHDCALFIPIISTTTQGRLEGYFRREWRLAVDRTHDMADGKPFLVPVVIDDTKDQDAEVPDAFRAVQWSRLPAGTASPAFVERVSRLLSPGQAPSAPIRPAAAPTPPQPAPTFAASRWKRPAGLLIAMFALIGVGYLVVDKFVLSKHPAPTTTSAPTVQSVAPAPSTIPEKSIAVLPFVDMSEKKDQEYFGDGMAEEMINLLVKIPELKVIGRTSSFQFKGKTDDLRKIGTALGAAYVVEGSVRRSGDDIRVTAQLIDTRDGTHRWSETYDRGAGDILKVQDEIAAGLVRALQLEVANPLVFQSQSALRNSEAYDIYLRGLHAADRFDQRGFEEAVVYFRRALDLDPAFVPALEALAQTYQNQVNWGFAPARIAIEQSRAAAEAALKLDPKSAVAHAALAVVHFLYDWDWPAAAREVTEAMTFAPNNTFVLKTAAMERLAVGEWSEALRFTDAAIIADPLDSSNHVVRGWSYMRLNRLGDAERAFQRALDISPTYAWGYYFLGIDLVLEGRAEDALAVMQKESFEEAKVSGLTVVYQALHRTKDADAALARLMGEHTGDWAFQIAEAYAYREQKDQAFAWLDNAYAQKNGSLYYIKGDQLLKNVEGDPRYKAFLRKMNLPE